MLPGHSRRSLFNGLLGTAGAALIAAWVSLGRARRERLVARRVVLAKPLADGVTFEQDVVLVRSGAEVRAFSARCPHLGCRLSRVDAGVLICPCHGSRFDTKGSRLAGPASSGLLPLVVEERAADGRIEVVLAS
jgi:Rieske Fe-S protein